MCNYKSINKKHSLGYYLNGLFNENMKDINEFKNEINDICYAYNSILI